MSNLLSFIRYPSSNLLSRIHYLLSFLILNYLRFFAKLKLAQINPIIIGVTGSAGKSSCVAAIEAILKTKFRVKTTGTANSESGIPLAILGLKLNNYSFFDWLRVILLAPFAKLDKFDVLVAEMGIDELKPPKNMEFLLSIIQPKIGVFLNALPAHTEQMGSVKNIFAEKSKLIKSLPADGTAIINSEYNIETKAKIIKFKDDGTAIPPALAVGKIFGINKMPKFDLPPGRWSIFEGINQSTIIDSSYNSSPVPAKIALEKLAKYKNRKIAVLGDMRELGDLAKEEHQKLAEIAKKFADEIITVGPLWKQYAKFDHQFDNFYQAGKFLQTFIKKNDIILFKGSQNTIFLEGAIEMVLANKSDVNKLCRRGKFWEKQRELSLRGVPPAGGTTRQST